ncbi:MAG: STAS domain-containing protein [Roseiflexaceae bacterium]|nr:STAS domain-containing protein [Roseiflexaceae bacterium]
MITKQALQPSVYEQAQLELFQTNLKIARITVLIVAALLLGSLIFPAARTLQVSLIIGAVLCEYVVIELSLWLCARQRLRTGAQFYIVATLIIAAPVMAVVGLPGLLAVITALLIFLSAQLISPRSAIIPGLAGAALSAVLSLGEHLGWFTRIALPEGANWVVALQIVFVISCLAAIVMVSISSSGRLQQIANVAQVRAEDAEQAQVGMAALNADLAVQVAQQHRLLEVIQDLEVPTIPVLPGVLVLPLISHLDSQRLDSITTQLLEQVAKNRVSHVLVDVTGVPVIDRAAAAGIVRLAQSLQLLGAEVMITGFTARNAQAFVEIDIGLGTVQTYASIQDVLSQRFSGFATVARAV